MTVIKRYQIIKSLANIRDEFAMKYDYQDEDVQQKYNVYMTDLLHAINIINEGEES